MKSKFLVCEFRTSEIEGNSSKGINSENVDIFITVQQVVQQKIVHINGCV